uniref:DUF295 domain-containing protein n=1 Tax=Setaria viridis TaxID=4556 RepID=A0A4U6SVU3_SETVI|nr:hypothetical protein SEVIR_9G092600v2 [Setaria viridis]
MEESDEEKPRTPKRRRVGRGSDGGPGETRRRHLYLVLDDWSSGYSILKVDLSPSDRCCRRCGGRRHQPCLSPSLFRFEASAPCGVIMSPYFSAAGSSIMAMILREGGGGASCFDVHARDALGPTYFPIGDDRLFVLGAFSFHVLDMPLPDAASGTSQLDPLSWRELPDAPADCTDVVSHVVLPDGQTIFVSVGIIPDDEATYSFHMAGNGSSVWRYHGGWALLFRGRGYFDGDLNVWVGLSAYRPEEIGRVCACELVSAGSDYGRRPAWKLSKEKLFSEDPAEVHMGATLLYMGGKSRFCLVECVYIKGGRDDVAYEYDEVEEEDPPTYLFRVTTFSLKLDENGDLTTGNSRRVRYYSVPEVASNGFHRNPVAFWM